MTRELRLRAAINYQRVRVIVCTCTLTMACWAFGSAHGKLQARTSNGDKRWVGSFSCVASSAVTSPHADARMRPSNP